MQKTRDIVLLFSDKPVTVHPIYKKVTSSFGGAIFLAQVIYWENAMKGEYYKTNDSWCEELFMTESELRLAKEKCAPFINIVKKGLPAKNYYSVNWEKLEKELEHHSTSSVENHSTGDVENHSTYNTEITTEINNTGTAKADPNIPLIIDLFKTVDPTYRKYFKNTTERKACAELLIAFSMEQIQERVSFVPMYNKLPYINGYNKVYKPSDLLRNWQAMEDNLASARNIKKDKQKEFIT